MTEPLTPLGEELEACSHRDGPAGVHTMRRVKQKASCDLARKWAEECAAWKRWTRLPEDAAIEEMIDTLKQVRERAHGIERELDRV